MKNTLRAKEDFTDVKYVARPNIVNSGPIAGVLQSAQNGARIGFRSFLNQIGEGSLKRLFYHKVKFIDQRKRSDRRGSARTWDLSKLVH